MSMNYTYKEIYNFTFNLYKEMHNLTLTNLIKWEQQ